MEFQVGKFSKRKFSKKRGFQCALDGNQVYLTAVEVVQQLRQRGMTIEFAIGRPINVEFYECILEDHLVNLSVLEVTEHLLKFGMEIPKSSPFEDCLPDSMVDHSSLRDLLKSYSVVFDRPMFKNTDLDLLDPTNFLKHPLFKILLEFEDRLPQLTISTIVHEKMLLLPRRFYDESSIEFDRTGYSLEKDSKVLFSRSAWIQTEPRPKFFRTEPRIAQSESELLEFFREDLELFLTLDL